MKYYESPGLKFQARGGWGVWPTRGLVYKGINKNFKNYYVIKITRSMFLGISKHYKELLGMRRNSYDSIEMLGIYYDVSMLLLGF